MTEKRWTPGPWVVAWNSVYDMEGNREFPEFMRAGKQICRPCDKRASTYKNWSANAHLIAAAPDLVEALDKLRVWALDNHTVPTDIVADVEYALGKAYGEPNE